MIELDHVQLAAPPGCEGEARRFFGELLGLEELAKPEPLRSRGGVWFALGDGDELHVGVEEPFAPAGKAHPAFRLSAAELGELAERRRLVAMGRPDVHVLTHGRAAHLHAGVGANVIRAIASYAGKPVLMIRDAHDARQGPCASPP